MKVVNYRERGLKRLGKQMNILARGSKSLERSLLSMAKRVKAARVPLERAIERMTMTIVTCITRVASTFFLHRMNQVVRSSLSSISNQPRAQSLNPRQQ